jgi:hypothetical protein
MKLDHIVEAYLYLIERKEMKLAETNEMAQKKQLQRDIANQLVDLGNHINGVENEYQVFVEAEFLLTAFSLSPEILF